MLLSGVDDGRAIWIFCKRYFCIIRIKRIREWVGGIIWIGLDDYIGFRRPGAVLGHSHIAKWIGICEGLVGIENAAYRNPKYCSFPGADNWIDDRSKSITAAKN